jgi:NTP pyrophosphatase (non-canonical NTP hydrolase)
MMATEGMNRAEIRLRQALSEMQYESSMGIGLRSFSQHHIDALTQGLLPFVDNGAVGIFEDVLEFHEKLAPWVISNNGWNARPDAGPVSLYLKLIAEEVGELFAATGGLYRVVREDVDHSIYPPLDLIEVADGIADSIVVITGLCLVYGIPLPRVWDEVHRTNMAKEGGPLREDRKIMKPAGWLPPDIEGIRTDCLLAGGSFPPHAGEMSQREVDALWRTQNSGWLNGGPLEVVSIGGRYKHFKGGIYIVKDTSRREGDGVLLVTYYPEGKPQETFTRPIREWVERVPPVHALDEGAPWVPRYALMPDGEEARRAFSNNLHSFWDSFPAPAEVKQDCGWEGCEACHPKSADAQDLEAQAELGRS